MQKTGINDIAVHLDISRNTVSKVMNDRGNVSDRVRKQVIEASVELGYTKIPSRLLEEYEMMRVEVEDTQKKSKNILVIATSPDFSTFWGKIINGITTQLAEEGYNCLYNFLTFDQEKNFEVPEMLKQDNIAGIIVMNVYNTETVKKITNIGIPAVYYDMPLALEMTELKADVIVVEGRKSIYNITSHLISQNDKLLGFIGDISYCKSIEERWRGFIRAHNDKGIKIHSEHCFIGKKKGHLYFDREIEGIIENLIKEGAVLPNGFVCANDDIAYRAIKELKKHGYRVPEDIRISGFDDIDVSETDDKILTTVKINIKGIGERLAEKIIWRINQPSHRDRDYEVIKIVGKVEFRASTQR